MDIAMSDLVPRAPSFTIQKIRFLKELIAPQIYRILLNHGVRFTESPVPNIVVYSPRVHVFTVHEVALSSGSNETLYADVHGWGFTEFEIDRLEHDGIVLRIKQERGRLG